MIAERITSLQNARIKETVSLLEKSRARRESSLFVVEGRRELEQCIDAGYRLCSVFYNPQILPETEIEKIARRIAVASRAGRTAAKQNNAGEEAGAAGTFRQSGPVFYSLSPEVYKKLAYREGTEGVLAVAQAKSHAIENIVLSANPLVLVVEKVEKPGNLGALLRTADACGADALLVCDPLTDLYNPNLIRSSLGGIFTRQIAACTNEQALAWLQKNNIFILTAQLQDSRWYYDADMRGPCAIVMGSEALGLTEFWRRASGARIKIPMLGRLDSLNVSVSAAVLCYEAVRQRNLAKEAHGKIPLLNPGPPNETL